MEESRQRRKILIVDDDPSLLEALERAFIEAGERAGGRPLSAGACARSLRFPGPAIVRGGETHIYRAEPGNRGEQRSDENGGRRRVAVAFLASVHVFLAHHALNKARHS